MTNNDRNSPDYAALMQATATSKTPLSPYNYYYYYYDYYYSYCDPITTDGLLSLLLLRHIIRFTTYVVAKIILIIPDGTITDDNKDLLVMYLQWTATWRVIIIK